MSKTTVEILREARGYVEQGWTQGEDARDEAGDPTPPEGSRAVCWCMSGACIRADPGSMGTAVNTPIRDAIGEYWYVKWNDAPERTKEEVLAAFDRAIAAEEAKQ